MRIAGLFSGIGGLGLPFVRRGIHADLLCDIWEPSQRVLRKQFPNSEIFSDIRKLRSLPSGTSIVTAGFPCTDLSQVGKTAGISGSESGLVREIFRLIKRQKLDWLVLENVTNMLVLDRGSAMKLVTSELESLGYRWAYRLVDSRFSGVPQRRHRVILVASKRENPVEVLFADDAGDTKMQQEGNAFGFYWTEGLRGLGWVKDGVPPLKGGSTIGIPSPPAIWIPQSELGRQFVTPSIEDAKGLQGFPRGWTSDAAERHRNGPRWKLVGNAVSVGVADWIVGRLLEPGSVKVDLTRPISGTRWPEAAHGAKGKHWAVGASAFPIQQPYTHLLDLLSESTLKPLSQKAAAGFLSRARRASLKFHPEFLDGLSRHIAHLGDAHQQMNRPEKRIAA